ncbi:chitinase [Histoplasma capsulatum G186AR]|uniref:Chitinase n=1 Tax=Ajellomyces capsulatus TaxID=5037 RepID=A0A8H7YGB3_AJECA|nr:chitinase [Histoplasma capsulatum]QSS72875.1 chitinase [Histoplasma capsulatum G186AR]
MVLMWTGSILGAMARTISKYPIPKRNGKSTPTHACSPSCALPWDLIKQSQPQSPAYRGTCWPSLQRRSQASSNL